MKEQHEIQKQNEEKLQLLKEGILEDTRKKLYLEITPNQN